MARFRLGVAHQLAGDTEKAVEVLQQALLLEPVCVTHVLVAEYIGLVEEQAGFYQQVH